MKNRKSWEVAEESSEKISENPGSTYSMNMLHIKKKKHLVRNPESV
jgi:hypothetical protein